MGKKTVNDEELVQWMEEQGDPAYMTSEIADAFDMSVEGMRNRLTQLAEDGRVEFKKPSSKTVFWWPKNPQSGRIRA